MWFLKYLFVMSLICYTLKKGLRRDWLVLVAILILFSVTRTGIFRLLPYLWLGYMMHQAQGKIQQYRGVILLISGPLFMLFAYLWQGDYDAPLRFLYFKPTIFLHREHLYAVLVRLAVGTWKHLLPNPISVYGALPTASCLNETSATYRAQYVRDLLSPDLPHRILL
mgnify:CR=1 FL=1